MLFQGRLFFIALGMIAVTAFFSEKRVVQAQTVDEILEKCEESVENTSQQTVGLDMQSYVLMNQAVNTVTSATGKSIKVAHQANALINGVMSANATKRCGLCKSALASCRSEDCSKEQCESIVQAPQQCQCSVSSYGCNSTSIPNKKACIDMCKKACKNCKEELTKGRKECQKFASPCDQVCLQAGISATEALKSYLTANQLSGCQGEECNKSKDSDSDNNDKESFQIPDPIKSPSNTAEFSGVESKPFSYNNTGGAVAQLSGNKHADKADKADKTDGGKAKKNLQKKTESQNGYSGQDSSGLASPNSLNQASEGGGISSDSFSYNDQNGKSFPAGSKKKARRGRKSNPELVEGDFNQHFPKAVSGAESSPYQKYQGLRANFAGNSQSDFNKMAERELAKGGIEKKKNQVSDNIFVKMSRFIDKFCGSDKKC